MNSINTTVFVGNLTRDAELSYTGSGFAICKLSIAINRSKKVNDQWEDRPSYFDLTGLGKRYESLNQYLTKGSKIAVECHAEQDRWEKDGVKRSKVNFVIDNIELVGGRDMSAKAAQPDKHESHKPVNDGKFEDDIPF